MLKFVSFLTLVSCVFGSLSKNVDTTEVPVVADDGSDDANATSGLSLNWTSRGLKELEDGFIRMDTLTSLILDDNEISKISSKAFQFTPSLEYLSFTGNKLRNLTLEPFSELENLRYLNLMRSSDVSVLPYGTAQPPYDSTPDLPSLTYLHLEDNALEFLTFSGGNFPALTHLYLSQNLLEFEEETWTNLTENAPSLAYLYLEGNSMVGFDASLIKNLTHLDLGNNFIESICRDNCTSNSLRLNGCDNLSILDASSNLISIIEVDAFDGATNLVDLDLSENAIETIVPGTFECLTILKRLNLQGNELVDIDGQTLIGGPNELEVLRLDNNRISRLSSDSFANLTRLIELTLNNNEISSVDTETFSELNDLEKLSIAGNFLALIPTGTLPTSTALKTLDLSYNRFNDTEYISLGNSSTNLQILNVVGNPWTDSEPSSIANMPEGFRLIA